jgi:hypothetical protein
MRFHGWAPARMAGAFAVLLALLVLAPAGAHAAADYTQQATTASGKVTFAFTPATTAKYVDVHWLVNGSGQQNVRMTLSNGTWRTTTGALPSGAAVTYWFTYEKNGPQYDSPRVTATVAGGSTAQPQDPQPSTDGRFPAVFRNDTGGRWADNQIYITVIGQTTPGSWHYLRPDGTFAAIDHTMADAAGHLEKNGRGYPNMSFTLAQASTVQMPSSIDGGRIFVSMGQPMYLPVDANDRGWGGPDLNNPTDPNHDTVFDWYELAFRNGQTNFGGNTTGVDQFGLPLTARVQQTSSGYDRTTGIALSRDAVRARFAAATPAIAGLMDQYRILAPHSAPSFAAGGAQGRSLDATIDAVWQQWATQGLHLTRLGQTFDGRVVDGRLRFTKDGVGGYSLGKPTTQDVLGCAGPLASGGMSPVELELGAEVCAAFNRGVAANTADWYRPAAYYPAGVPANGYAALLHAVSLGGLAYGFPYDDVNDQSPVAILPNAAPPTRLTIGIGW